MTRVTRVPVRDDLQALEGYHSPQVSVAVRLNTNESPEPPPAAWRDALAAELSRLEWHRYPDRGARELRAAIGASHGVPAEQVFAANGSNEVLQTLLLTFAYFAHIMTFYFIIKYHYRSLTARSYTAAYFQGDISIGCRLSNIDAQHLLGFINQLRGAAHITGCSQAELDGMFAAWSVGKK
jgi:histidinol-phosphate/aromatic aminotransferase/cobyric acid decarboxylase-like protein